MSRAGDSVTRVDIRFSNEMYEAIQQLALQDGARTHHISQKVEVSPTIIKLVQLALDNIAGRLSDSKGNVPDSLSDIATNNLPDRDSNVSGISDTRIKAIVDRRLAELGLFPSRQIESGSTPNFLPDKSDVVPDNISDKDVLISDRVTILPDNLPDTINIPSDDSSNSESIAEDVQVTKADAIEQVSRDASESFSFGEFYDWLGLPRSARNKSNSDIAINSARSQGRGEWAMSKSYKFTKQSEDN